MTLPQRAGQLLLVGVPLTDPAAGTGTLRRSGAGGAFLAGRSAAGVAGLRAGTDALRDRTRAGAGLLVALDQEGGLVQSLRGPGVDTVPGARRQSATAPASLERDVRRWAGQLHRAGVSLDLAPVADVVPESSRATNPAVGVNGRSFGGDPAEVGADVAAWVRGCLAGGVQPTLKHFPGLGRVTADTDTRSAVVDDVTDRSAATLAPWRAGLAAGAGVVMVSSATYPRIDAGSPAAFSRTVVTGMLRGDLDFEGVVMTDDVAAAALASVPAGERAVRFVEAGGDLVLSVDPRTATELASALVDRARDDAAFAELVRRSAERVVALKLRAGVVPG